jgi:hypothetical protein
VPAALRRRGSGGAVGRRRGRRLVRSLPRTAWLVWRGSGGWPVTSGGPAPGTGIPTVPATIAVNVGIDGSGREIPDVTGVDAEPAGHTLPPYPAHAVTANRTSADCDGAADRPRRRPTSGADGVEVRRQRRTNRPAAPGLRRYRRISTATSHSTCERAMRATLPSSAPTPPATPPFPRTQPMPLRRQNASRLPRRRRPTTHGAMPDNPARRGAPENTKPAAPRAAQEPRPAQATASGTSGGSEHEPTAPSHSVPYSRIDSMIGTSARPLAVSA